jgi:hypothetical protein
MPVIAGYQWKSLFLPNGTLLRTVFNGKNFHCLVEDDRIHFNGQSVSPSGFANAVGGMRRNAWKVIWVLFPNTSEWKLAGTLRAGRNTQRPRAEGQALPPNAGEGDRFAGGRSHPPAPPVKEQNLRDEPQLRDDRSRRDRRERRALQDRRRVQRAVQQESTPERGPT